jgi:TatD DNase family protein
MRLEQTKPKLIDSHAHTQFSDYDGDRREVIERALGAGIWMVNSGADMDSSEKAVKLAEQYKEGVYATVGVHPSEKSAKIHDREFWRKLGELAKSGKCVAVGECGLEYFPDTSADDKRLQAELFEYQINLANEIGKPLVVHCRDAYDDLYEILKKNGNKLIPERSALMHFFSGTVEYADRFLEMGFVFSFGGAATFTPKPGKTSLAEGPASTSLRGESPTCLAPRRRRADFISLIKRLPIEAILIETDCPYVTPVPLRGQRNEPSFVVHVANKIAEIKGISEREAAEATTENALRFFAIDGPSR